MAKIRDSTPSQIDMKSIELLYRRTHQTVLDRQVVKSAEYPRAVQRTAKRALLYYKTDPFLVRAYRSSLRHTNMWEIVTLVNLLAEFGYSVDVVDRSFDGPAPRPPYDLFLGIGSGYSGRHFSGLARTSLARKKILLATGPRPEASDELVIDQYNYFNERHSFYAPPMRTFPDLPFDDFLTEADAIIAIGEAGQFCAVTYQDCGLSLRHYYPGVASINQFSQPKTGSDSHMRKFLCFAGNGFICKGVDLVVEAFLQMPNLMLTICGPPSETAFFHVLGKKIDNAPNIDYVGFVPAFSRRYRNLINGNQFSILASSSEGCATSLATTMVSGLIPIVTPEVGIDVSRCGFLINVPRRERIEAIIEVCKIASGLDQDCLNLLAAETYVEAQKFSHNSFIESMRAALIDLTTTE